VFQNSSIVLGGKIDGLTDDGNLVELKNRQYRFFSKIPEYELVQVHAYMYLLDKTECTLVQCFKKEFRKDQVYFDNDYWNKIMCLLETFSNEFKQILEQKTCQDDFLNGKDIFPKD
jgi:hypothetical protein